MKHITDPLTIILYLVLITAYGGKLKFFYAESKATGTTQQRVPNRLHIPIDEDNGTVLGKQGYVVMLDAGSSSTRMHIFEYVYDDDACMFKGKVSLRIPYYQYKHRKDITSIITAASCRVLQTKMSLRCEKTQEDDNCAYTNGEYNAAESLKNLLLNKTNYTAAEEFEDLHNECTVVGYFKEIYRLICEHIPAAEQRSRSPIMLKATGGVRSLKQYLTSYGKEKVRESNIIIDVIYEHLKSFGLYLYGRNAVDTLDGREEGIYGWLSLYAFFENNYISGFQDVENNGSKNLANDNLINKEMDEKKYMGNLEEKHLHQDINPHLQQRERKPYLIMSSENRIKLDELYHSKNSGKSNNLLALLELGGSSAQIVAQLPDDIETSITAKSTSMYENLFQPKSSNIDVDGDIYDIEMCDSNHKLFVQSFSYFGREAAFKKLAFQSLIHELLSHFTMEKKIEKLEKVESIYPEHLGEKLQVETQYLNEHSEQLIYVPKYPAFLQRRCNKILKAYVQLSLSEFLKSHPFKYGKIFTRNALFEVCHMSCIGFFHVEYFNRKLVNLFLELSNSVRKILKVQHEANNSNSVIDARNKIDIELPCLQKNAIVILKIKKEHLQEICSIVYDNLSHQERLHNILKWIHEIDSNHLLISKLRYLVSPKSNAAEFLNVLFETHQKAYCLNAVSKHKCMSGEKFFGSRNKFFFQSLSTLSMLISHFSPEAYLRFNRKLFSETVFHVIDSSNIDDNAREFHDDHVYVTLKAGGNTDWKQCSNAIESQLFIGVNNPVLKTLKKYHNNYKFIATENFYHIPDEITLKELEDLFFETVEEMEKYVDEFNVASGNANNKQSLMLTPKKLLQVAKYICSISVEDIPKFMQFGTSDPVQKSSNACFGFLYMQLFLTRIVGFEFEAVIPVMHHMHDLEMSWVYGYLITVFPLLFKRTS